MFETFLWLFVFVAWACWRCRDEEEQEMSGQWYLIYRYRWVGVDLVIGRDAIDGVYAVHADAAIIIAAGRNDYRTDERFNAVFERLKAVFCSTVAQRLLASDLDGRHSCDWWSRTDFADWMRQPAYSGDQNKYFRTLKS